MDGLERVLAVVGIVARSDVEALAADVRSDDLLIAVALLNLAQEFLQTQTQGCTLRQPHGQTFTHTVAEEEEFHFLTNLAVVALLGFLEFFEIFVEQFLFRERDAIDTCHHRTFLVATPVGSSHREHLHGLDGSRRCEVGTAAKVGEITLCISCDVSVFQFGNQFVLVRLTAVAEELQGIFLRYVAAHERFLALHEFLHLLFNLWEVGHAQSHAFGWHDVVVETILDGRTDAELCARPEFLQGLGHEVGRSVPEGVFAFFVIPLVEFQFRILGDGTVQFRRFSIHTTGDDVLCQTRADALSNLQASHACFVFADASVRKSNLNHSYFIYKFKLFLCVQKIMQSYFFFSVF